MFPSIGLGLVLMTQDAKAADSNSLESRLDAVANKQIQDGHAVGISVAVVKGGKLVLSKQYGLASLRANKPVTATSEFPIGSVSKQFTAACILLLYEEGKLSLDDPVAHYFPDLTRAKEIKIRDLLNHTSGYSDWYPLDYIDNRLKHGIAPDAVMRKYGTLPLDFEPGSQYSYSNTGYLVAARVVESVSKQPFFKFLRDRILKPLKMTHTQEYRLRGADVVERYSSFFGGPIEPADLEAPGWLLGAGGLLSTPEDLAKWDTALMSGRVLQPSSWQAMTSTRRLTSGAISSYGFGQAMGNFRGHQLVGHTGGVSGGVTDNILVPDANFAFVCIGNYDLMSFSPFNRALLENLKPLTTEPTVPSSGPSASPTIAPVGPPALEVAKTLFTQISEDQLDRTNLTPECSEYLSESKLKANRQRLTALGPPAEVKVLSTSERGHMEVTELLFQFKSTEYRTLLYRRSDGKVAEFMVTG